MYWTEEPWQRHAEWKKPDIKATTYVIPSHSKSKIGKSIEAEIRLVITGAEGGMGHGEW